MGTSPTRADLAEALANDNYPRHLIDPGRPCPWCFQLHGNDVFVCSSVKAYEFDSSGNVTRIEFLVPADFGRAQPAAEPEAEYPRKQPRSG